VDGPRAWDLDLAFDLAFDDLGRNFRVTLRNGVLVHVEKPADAATAGATVTLSKPRLLSLLGGDRESAGVAVEGDAGILDRLMSVLDRGDPSFSIVVP
ncbi:MAG TPA: alkyl sulfatase C-terminal domain-containing protein, partial [Agromyces sp.]|nr:alkyl sulfatase C-terminal domain-containing protein [Agromyces sp.]